MRSGPCSLGTRAAPILHNRGATGKGTKRKTVMRKHSLMLLAAAFALAAGQASAADVPRKARPSHRRPRLQLLGPGVTSAPTSAGYLAAPSYRFGWGKAPY